MGCATGDTSSKGKGRLLALKPAELPGLSSHSISAGEHVFGNEGEWRDFWQEHNNGPVPKIDFERYILAIVALGQKPNPGHSVEITGATEYRREVVIDVVERLPLPGGMYAQVIVHPYKAVLVPATGKQIRFDLSRPAGRP